MKLTLHPENEPAYFAVTDYPRFRIRQSPRLKDGTQIYKCIYNGMGKQKDIQIESKSLYRFIEKLEKHLNVDIQIWSEETGHPVRLDVDGEASPEDIPVKQCAVCLNEKKITEFYKNGRGTFGVRATCKKCMALDRNKKRQQNKMAA